MTGSGSWGSMELPWAEGDPWGGGVVALSSAFIQTTPFDGAFLETDDPERVLIDMAVFFKNYTNWPGVWHPENTSNRTPIVVREEELRRLSFTNSDIITVREDESEFEPVAIQYAHKNDVTRLVFRMWTRHSREQAVRLPKELERVLDDVRLDTFGLLPGDAGRAWLKVTEVTRAEHTTRLYWYREMRVEVLRRYRKVTQS